MKEQKRKTTSKKDWNGVWYYEEAGLVSVANSISTILSSLLPTTSIVVLYFVQEAWARLLVTMIFTALFSITLAAITKARRVDVFAATTA